jgi:hypothetical protein
MLTEIKTYKLRNGAIVYSKKGDWPVTYTNRTAAEKSAEKLKAQGINCGVIQPGLSVCFYVAISQG